MDNEEIPPTIDETITEGTKVSEEKLYQGINLYWSTVIGGPLVGGYMIASNYKTLGEKEKIPLTWILTISLTFLLFALLHAIPHTVILNLICPFLYAFIPYYIVGNYQAEKIKSFIAGGGKFYELGRIVTVVLIGAIVTVLIFAILF